MDKYTPELVERVANLISETFAVAADMLLNYAERLRQDDKDALDAARYRWLRNRQDNLYLLVAQPAGEQMEDLLDGIDLDETIDAALKDSEK